MIIIIINNNNNNIYNYIYDSVRVYIYIDR